MKLIYRLFNWLQHNCFIWILFKTFTWINTICKFKLSAYPCKLHVLYSGCFVRNSLRTSMFCIWTNNPLIFQSRILLVLPMIVLYRYPCLFCLVHWHEISNLILQLARSSRYIIKCFISIGQLPTIGCQICLVE